MIVYSKAGCVEEHQSIETLPMISPNMDDSIFSSSSWQISTQPASDQLTHHWTTKAFLCLQAVYGRELLLSFIHSEQSRISLYQLKYCRQEGKHPVVLISKPHHTSRSKWATSLVQLVCYWHWSFEPGMDVTGCNSKESLMVTIIYNSSIDNKLQH